MEHIHPVFLTANSESCGGCPCLRFQMCCVPDRRPWPAAGGCGSDPHPILDCLIDSYHIPKYTCIYYYPQLTPLFHNSSKRALIHGSGDQVGRKHKNTPFLIKLWDIIYISQIIPVLPHKIRQFPRWDCSEVQNKFARIVLALRFATYNYEYTNGLYKYLWSISYHGLYRDYHSLVLHSRISYHGLSGCCLTLFIHTLYFYSSKLAGWLCNQGYGNGLWLEIAMFSGKIINQYPLVI
jgi:hypothetical protein